MLGHLEMVHAAKKEWKGPLLLGIDLSHLWDFNMRRGSSDLESMKAVGHQVQEIQYGAGITSVSQSTASWGWEEKREPTLGPSLHGVRSLCPSLEMPCIGTALENEPAPGDKAAAGGVQLLPFLMGAFPTNGLHGAQEKG